MDTAAVITSISKHSGVRKQPSRGAFSTRPKATPRHRVQTESFIPKGVAGHKQRGLLGMDSARKVLASSRSSEPEFQAAVKQRILNLRHESAVVPKQTLSQ